MASNHTANFGLNQWAATDPVLREDFNEDNQKIEEAMGGFGNCRIVTGSYVGTGQARGNSETANTLELGVPAQMILIQSPQDSFGALFLRSNNQGMFLRGGSTYDSRVGYRVTWTETGVTWYVDTTYSLYDLLQLDTLNQTYRYFAFY